MGIKLGPPPLHKTSQFKELLQHVLDNGHRKNDRTNVGTISMFGYQCRFDLQEGFPIVTEKRTAFKAAVTELIWMIGGWMKLPEYFGIQRTNIKFLLDNDCHIWTEWPYKAYCERYSKAMNLTLKPGYQPLSMKEYEERIKSDRAFAIEFGDLGPVYQKQWRDFEGLTGSVDQLEVMLHTLRNKPDDRRMLSSYWNPTELDAMSVSGLPPCHLLHQVWTRELTDAERVNILGYYYPPHNGDADALTNNNVPTRMISLQMYQRSSDCFLGVPFDWVFYSLLIHMLAEQTNMVPGELIWTSGDTHLYTNSIEASKEVLSRETFAYPTLKISRKVDHIDDYVISDFELIDYKCGKAIKVAVAV